MTVGQLPAFARAVQPIGGFIEDIAAGRSSLDLFALLGVVAEHGEKIIEAVAVATGLDRKELEAATPDQLIALAVVVVKVNADFFKGRLTPAILAAMQRMKPPAPGAGLTP